MNDLDIHQRSAQLLLLNGHIAYHFLFVDCCFNAVSMTVFKTLTTTFQVNMTACDLENSFIFDNEA